MNDTPDIARENHEAYRREHEEMRRDHIEGDDLEEDL